ncbi:hypothetical protein [Desulfosporosinus sp. OT]|uniref:hypothetical protein n=1 Tax=Desulfosporosinus sp. OT TaxID=913865 RepID=UPI000223A15B|nr:hypothetical protein [Desulfosporosinus sp. OT]EGW39303.1 hypothetical protein DOT_2765 [Desulfosporosinus sp. OT]
MKRTNLISVIIVVLIIVAVLISVFPPKATGKNIEEAIEKSGRHVVKVIHLEKIMDGDVVFFYKSINGGKDTTLAAGYTKKTFWGWEWVNGGEQSRASEEPGQSITVQYFPATKDTPFPIAYGEISDPQIIRVSVQTDKRAKEKEASIVKNGTTSIWFVFLNPSDGTQIRANGLSQSGQTLISNSFSL